MKKNSLMKALSAVAVSAVALSAASMSAFASDYTIKDCFDAICNDLTSGLPAEIEARQKQYEYYRDKLLTFKERG